MTFILVWITTFKNGMCPRVLSGSLSSDLQLAYRIDASIRPRIRVNYLEQADHTIFDITIFGIFMQCVLAAAGYSWMYALTRRTKLSVLAALPPFLLNILYLGTHKLCSALDVFVSYSRGTMSAFADFPGLALIRRTPFHLPLSRCLLALALRAPGRYFDFCMVIWDTKLPRNHNPSHVPYRSPLVRRSIRLPSPTWKL